jgi:hypothetical protein
MEPALQYEGAAGEAPRIGLPRRPGHGEPPAGAAPSAAIGRPTDEFEPAAGLGERGRSTRQYE